MQHLGMHSKVSSFDTSCDSTGCKTSSPLLSGPTLRVHPDCIRDVWASNLREEMRNIQRITEQYKYISIDTEFPGVVVTPLANADQTSQQWNTIRCNVNILKIIQLGMCFCDQHGNHPPGVNTWQFNFQFDVNSDMYAQDSLEMLEKAGLDFDRHRTDGIDVNTFAELMISSGLVLNPDYSWIAFHSGYDFGYILKVLTNSTLPDTESEFLHQITTWFGNIYDVKYLIKNCPSLNHRTGLNQLAADLQIERIGPAHQAGSDSLITSTLFFKLCQGYQPHMRDITQFASILYGLGEDSTDFSKDSFHQHPAHTRPFLERMEVY
jgi:CCR4-NOT transcription complex subunit 7/8